jgi:hypothetical protein
MSGAGRAGTTPDPSRVGIRSFAPLPVFTRGAKLWLHRGLAGDSLRDRQNGTLLLGRLDSWLPNADAEPVTLGALEPVCTRAEEDSCTIGRRMTYYSVEVNGDTPVVVSTAQHATLTLNATEYDLWLNAAERESDFGSAHCEDSGGPNDHRMHVAADILPRNPEAALANVEGGGELPDCVVGDTPPIEATVTVSGDPPNSNRYEGLVRYRGKEAGELLFEFVERTITVRLAVPAEVMPEPAPDATLWFATPGGNAFAFRASQGGELLLAHVSSADAPTARDFSPELGQLLGVSVAVESSCVTSALTKWPYQPVLVELHDLVFGTAPPVRVRSGTSGRIVLDGKAYDVRAAAVGKGLELTVLPVR